MALESYIRERLGEKSILLMTHIVIGYPSFEACYRIVETMVRAGVDLMELQIPFSEPIADGPVILGASQKALECGIKVKDCLRFAGDVSRDFRIPFLLMTYCNILNRRGFRAFVSEAAGIGTKGLIVPDLPHEEGEEYLSAMYRNSLSPILIFSPSTPLERMKTIAGHGRGFIYCVSRKGVTGAETSFSEDLARYLERCRMATSLPLALGFGVKDRKDVEFLRGKVDIAVIGSETIRVMDEKGIDAVGDFMQQLAGACSLSS